MAPWALQDNPFDKIGSVPFVDLQKLADQLSKEDATPRGPVYQRRVRLEAE